MNERDPGRREERDVVRASEAKNADETESFFFTREAETVTSERIFPSRGVNITRETMRPRRVLHVASILSLALVVVADADLAAASGDPSPPRAPAPRTLEQDLFACRVACQAELWDPVCVGGTMTYANACWARCASSLTRADAETPPEPARPGRCERERSPDENCVSGCVAAWGRDEASAPAFGWRPVCGEDGVTYTTACFAECSGVVSAEGACHDVDPKRRS